MTVRTALIFFLLFIFLPNAVASERTVSVYSVEGSAHLIRSGRTTDLKMDQACERGDRIDTSAGSRVDLSVYRFAGCRITGACRLEHTLESDVQFELIEGLFMVHMDASSANQMTVDAGLGTAEATGATFLCRLYRTADGRAATSFAAGEGTLFVTLKHSGATVKIPEHHSIDVTEDTYVPLVRSISAGEAEDLKQASSLVIANWPDSR